MALELLVPTPLGAHSTVGRATNRGMDKMRLIAVELIEEANQAQEAKKEAAERVAAERADAAARASKGLTPAGTKGPAKSVVVAPAPEEDENARPQPKKRGPRPMTTGSTPTPMGRAVREGLGLHGSSGATAHVTDPLQSPVGDKTMTLEEPQPSSPSNANKPTAAFTSQSPDAAKLDETSRVNLKRFFFSGQNKELPPPTGHYRAQDNVLSTTSRIKVMNFGYREPHPKRRIDRGGDDSRELGPEDLTVLDFTFEKSGTMFPSPKDFSFVTPSQGHSIDTLSSSRKELSLMTTSAERLPIEKSDGGRISLKGVVTMNETTSFSPFEEQDRNTTKVNRPPDVALNKQTGRKPFFGKMMPHFEAAKYNMHENHKYNVVLPPPKKFMGFEKQMDREKPLVSQKPKALLDSSEKGTGYHPDRSLYRTVHVDKPRVTHVRHMHKDTKRPPMFKIAAAFHDTDDPEVDRQVMERAMTIDTATLARAVDPRKDLGVKHHHHIAREKAGHGSRHAQHDLAMSAKRGHRTLETTGCLSKSVAELKDSIRLRPDLGVTFDQHKARGPTRLKGAHSSLHRPRDHAPPDFSRSAPSIGFSPSTTVKVMQRNRSHEAMPGWSPEAVDSLMDM